MKKRKQTEQERGSRKHRVKRDGGGELEVRTHKEVKELGSRKMGDSSAEWSIL